MYCSTASNQSITEIERIITGTILMNDSVPGVVILWVSTHSPRVEIDQLKKDRSDRRMGYEYTIFRTKIMYEPFRSQKGARSTPHEGCILLPRAIRYTKQVYKEVEVKWQRGTRIYTRPHLVPFSSYLRMSTMIFEGPFMMKIAAFISEKGDVRL